MVLWTIVILRKLIQIYMLVLFATALLSWVDVLPVSYSTRLKLYKVHSFLLKFSEPITSRIDKFVKPISLGNINLSVSFIILIAALFFIDTLLIYLSGLYISMAFGVDW